jgi:hypothetical protein
MYSCFYIDTFAGKPVKEWQSRIQDPEDACYALRLSNDESNEGWEWTDKFAAFLDDPSSSRVFGIIIGWWGAAYHWRTGISAKIVEALVTAHNRLPDLRAIFFGDIVSEEDHISYIQQTDLSPLLAAYPHLEHLGVRGSDGLSLGSLKHDRLKSLIIESVGLGANVVREVAGAELPELEHLELWLGTEERGCNATGADLAPILEGKSFPKLKYLGFLNCDFTDEIAQAVATAPVVERIRVLDLSLGTLGDEGAKALLQSPAISRLEKLDINHHFCSEEMTEKLESLDIEVNADDRLEPYDAGDEVWRYVAIME